jgi:hypothetical protein
LDQRLITNALVGIENNLPKLYPVEKSSEGMRKIQGRNLVGRRTHPKVFLAELEGQGMKNNLVHQKTPLNGYECQLPIIRLIGRWDADPE